MEDESGNVNNEFVLDAGHMDTLKPEVIKVSSEANINATNKELSTHTIVFDIVDKYMNFSSIAEPNICYLPHGIKVSISYFWADEKGYVQKNITLLTQTKEKYEKCGIYHIYNYIDHI